MVGASGIVGSATAALLVEQGWTSTASRDARPSSRACARSRPTCRIPPATARRWRTSRPTRVFITTWLRQDTRGGEHPRQRARWCATCSTACARPAASRHVALVTGLKHYLGPFEAYGKGTLPQTPFREEQGRLDVENFYYAQEDEVFAAAARDGFSWSVHRPAHGDRQGGRQRHEHGHDAGRLRHALPRDRPPVPLSRLGRAVERADRHDRCAAARPPSALGRDDAGGARPGVQRRQRRRLPLELDVGPASPSGSASSPRPSTAPSCRWRSRWRRTRPSGAQIAEREGLAEPDLGRLASPWHTDADLGRPIEVVTDMSKSRRLGFTGYQPTDDAFFDLFARAARRPADPLNGDCAGKAAASRSWFS